MKKVILVMLLIVAMAGCQLTMAPPDTKSMARAERKKVQAEAIERVGQLEIAKQEQQLILDILKLRYDMATIQNAMKPAVAPSEVKE